MGIISSTSWVLAIRRHPMMVDKVGMLFSCGQLDMFG